jgi:hypothetical protein
MRSLGKDVTAAPGKDGKHLLHVLCFFLPFPGSKLHDGGEGTALRCLRRHIVVTRLWAFAAVAATAEIDILHLAQGGTSQVPTGYRNCFFQLDNIQYAPMPQTLLYDQHIFNKFLA